MSRFGSLWHCLCGFLFLLCASSQIHAAPKRLVILKVDALRPDLLYRAMRESDPLTGKSKLPWLSHIFSENGVIFENFYSRGLSLSAPSWSLLDTGRHLVIKGNAEYDRFTGRIYDYLNFFPFYVQYARSSRVDMPSVEVLDEAGIPLLLDAFPYDAQYQSFQLFQRGVRWSTLKRALQKRFSGSLYTLLEDTQTGFEMTQSVAAQTERELLENLKNPNILYLDFFVGDFDHIAHATSDPATLNTVFRSLDNLAGRIWTTIQNTPLANETVFVLVSDHGINNVPGVLSQSYSLIDLLTSQLGGSHHVLTNRHLLSEYKIRGLDPFVSKVVTPSSSSSYLRGQEARYPTAMLDLDGNERASVHFRNSDLNEVQILLQQLARADLNSHVRRAANQELNRILNRSRTHWETICNALDEELKALRNAIKERSVKVAEMPKKWPQEDKESGYDKNARRQKTEFLAWQQEAVSYERFIAKMRKLFSLEPESLEGQKLLVNDFIPENAMGENNSVHQLQNYVAGLSSEGLQVKASGELDNKKSFTYINYFSLLASQKTKSRLQAALAQEPVDFIAMRLPLDPVRVAAHDPSISGLHQAIWLYKSDDLQLLLLTKKHEGELQLRLLPIADLRQGESGIFSWQTSPWKSGLPLHLLEDPGVRLPEGADRAAWFSSWHSEKEWMNAVHLSRYSNGVIGLTEELIPVNDAVPGKTNENPLLLRLERRRRELVEADFHVLANDHWNFNVRGFNPGGNHGGFFRISTHSVWMLAGGNAPHGLKVSAPYDSLNFASTILKLVGKTPPDPKQVVDLPVLPDSQN